MVYFIVTEDEKFVKIGYTNNLKNRMLSIQNGNPLEIILIRTIKGGMKKEQQIHKYLNKYHYKREWFIYNQEVKNYINNLSDNDDEPKHMRYDPLLNDEIEKLYSQRLSNIQISNNLNITIHKVRRIIKKRKLKDKYSHLPKPLHYHHGGTDNYVRKGA